MPARNQHSLHILLAPSRLVTGLVLRSGYDMGVAATISGKLTFEYPEFELAKDDLAAAEHALAAVDEVRAAWRWNPGWAYTIADRLRNHQEWLGEIRAAVAEGDRCLPALLRRGFMLAVTTTQEGNVKETVAPKRFTGFPAPTYPYSAAVSVQRAS